MKSKYDVIVVGGSCSGAAAGYLLAQNGLDVLIVDKSSFPRDKLCGGMVTEKALALLIDVYGDISKDEIINSSYSAYGIFLKGAGKICKFTNNRRHIYIVERTIFDDYFFRKAKEMGCEVITGSKVTEIINGAVQLESGMIINADNIIGSDGANSIIRKSVTGSINKKTFSVGMEVDISYDDLDSDADYYPKIYSGYVSYGYIWSFPKRDYLTVGIWGPPYSNKISLKKILVDFLRSELNYEIQPDKPLKAFPVPLHNLTKTPYKGNVLLAGDAAGFVEPVTGEGIYFAILSGKLVAQAILGERSISSEYAKALKKNIFPILKQAYFMRHFLYNSLTQKYVLYKIKNNAKYCKYYFDILSGEIDYIQYIKSILRDRKKYKYE